MLPKSLIYKHLELTCFQPLRYYCAICDCCLIDLGIMIAFQFRCESESKHGAIYWKIAISPHDSTTGVFVIDEWSCSIRFHPLRFILMIAIWSDLPYSRVDDSGKFLPGFRGSGRPGWCFDLQPQQANLVRFLLWLWKIYLLLLRHRQRPYEFHFLT